MYITFSIKPVVEFVRHDAEIMIDMDGTRFQKVITKGCKSNEEATKIAKDYCIKLKESIEACITNRTDLLKTAQP